MTLTETVIQFCTFPRATDSVPILQSQSWDNMALMLTNHDERLEKEGWLWSPAVYAPSTTRANENVECVTAAVADYDHDVDIVAIKQRLEPYEYVMYSTHRHAVEAPRVRVVIPFTQPVPRDEWPRVWQSINQHVFGPESDQAVKDASRAYYLPSCPPGAPRIAFRHRGQWLDPVTLPAANVVPFRQAPTIGDAIPEGRRNPMLTSLGGSMRRRGMSEGAILAALYYENKTRCTVPLDDKEVTQIAHNVAQYAPDNPILLRLGKGTLEPAATTNDVQIVSAAELDARVFAEPRWVVPGVLPEGGTIFAGRPKIGKSWLSLGLAIAVAGGGSALGKIEVEQGDVLYLALEDSDRRLQSRQRKLLMGRKAPPRLYYTTKWPSMDDGGLEKIESWLKAHPEARLVIVDTIKRLRPKEKKGVSSYTQDYDAVAPLADMARQYQVGLVMVHHVRKMEAEDPLDMISGTLGLTGAVDTAWVLSRSRGTADGELAVIGRDVEGELKLALHWSGCEWALLGDAGEYKLSQERRDLLGLVRTNGEPLSPKDASALLNKPYSTVKKLMWEMSNDGILKSIDGKYVENGNLGNRSNSGNRGNLGNFG